MTSAYSKSCGYKKFSVHANTKKYRFQIVPLWRAFSKSSVFVDLFMRISVDGRCIRNNKVAFSNLSGIVWTRPQFFQNLRIKPSALLVLCFGSSKRVKCYKYGMFNWFHAERQMLTSCNRNTKSLSVYMLHTNRENSLLLATPTRKKIKEFLFTPL